MNRERLVDEVLMLMPTLMRAIGAPDPAEMAEFASRGMPTDSGLLKDRSSSKPGFRSQVSGFRVCR